MHVCVVCLWEHIRVNIHMCAGMWGMITCENVYMYVNVYRLWKPGFDVRYLLSLPSTLYSGVGSQVTPEFTDLVKLASYLSVEILSLSYTGIIEEAGSRGRGCRSSLVFM